MRSLPILRAGRGGHASRHRRGAEAGRPRDDPAGVADRRCRPSHARGPLLEAHAPAARRGAANRDHPRRRPPLDGGLQLPPEDARGAAGRSRDHPRGHVARAAAPDDPLALPRRPVQVVAHGHRAAALGARACRRDGRALRGRHRRRGGGFGWEPRPGAAARRFRRGGISSATRDPDRGTARAGCGARSRNDRARRGRRHGGSAAPGAFEARARRGGRWLPRPAEARDGR